MTDLYSVDEANGDEPEQFASAEGLDDFSENVSQALEGDTDGDEPEQEEPGGGSGDLPVQTVEEVLAASHEALKGVKPKDITKAIGILCRIDDDRKELNAERKAEVDRLVGLGFPSDALNSLHTRCKQDPLVRAAILPAYNYGCEVMDAEQQSEMFPKH